MTEYTREVYQQIASKIHVIENCNESNNDDWMTRHSNSLIEIANHYLPHGSGIDSGCNIDDNSTQDKIIINSAYHAMDENGFYCGWIHFDVIVIASLEFNIDVEFDNIENDSDFDDWDIESLFDCLHQTFDYALRESLPLI